MAWGRVLTHALVGASSQYVTVEAFHHSGNPKISIVGLSEAQVRGSRERVRGALASTGLEPCLRVFTINIHPPVLIEQDGRFDLPIALAILASVGKLESSALEPYLFLGGLALSGAILSSPQLLQNLMFLRDSGRVLYAPPDPNVSSIEGGRLDFRACSHLLDLFAHLKCGHPLPEITGPKSPVMTASTCSPSGFALDGIRGQNHAKRVLCISAAGRHPMVLSGPPGVGKTLLASALAELLPPPSREETLEIGLQQSFAHDTQKLASPFQRPFRAPHHSASMVALVGGGNPPKPGEISLAHGGVLFLDEWPEFSKETLEALRQPLESGTVTVSRSGHSIRFPADFLLVAAMNPCPCGFYDSSRRSKISCHCAPGALARYRSKISGPLWDRIDLQLQVHWVPPEILLEASASQEGPSALELQDQIAKAWAIQKERQQMGNARLTHGQLQKYVHLGLEAKKRLSEGAHRWHWSARTLHRILKVARTIADLEGSSGVEESHVLEAMYYRQRNPG